jgi:hypothetical protein
MLRLLAVLSLFAPMSFAAVPNMQVGVIRLRADAGDFQKFQTEQNSSTPLKAFGDEVMQAACAQYSDGRQAGLGYMDTDYCARLKIVYRALDIKISVEVPGKKYPMGRARIVAGYVYDPDNKDDQERMGKAEQDLQKAVANWAASPDQINSLFMSDRRYLLDLPVFAFVHWSKPAAGKITPPPLGTQIGFDSINSSTVEQFAENGSLTRKLLVRDGQPVLIQLKEGRNGSGQQIASVTPAYGLNVLSEAGDMSAAIYHLELRHRAEEIFGRFPLRRAIDSRIAGTFHDRLIWAPGISPGTDELIFDHEMFAAHIGRTIERLEEYGHRLAARPADHDFESFIYLSARALELLKFYAVQRMGWTETDLKFLISSITRVQGLTALLMGGPPGSSHAWWNANLGITWVDDPGKPLTFTEGLAKNKKTADELYSWIVGHARNEECGNHFKQRL